MDTGHTADSGIATLARRRGPIAAIGRANPFALIAIDEGGGELARQHRDQGSPHPGSALLCRIAGTGSMVRGPMTLAARVRRPMMPPARARRTVRCGLCL